MKKVKVYDEGCTLGDKTIKKHKDVYFCPYRKSMGSGYFWRE